MSKIDSSFKLICRSLYVTSKRINKDKVQGKMIVKETREEEIGLSILSAEVSLLGMQLYSFK